MMDGEGALNDRNDERVQNGKGFLHRNNSYRPLRSASAALRSRPFPLWHFVRESMKLHG
jgi:hypothetical protein